MYVYKCAEAGNTFDCVCVYIMINYSFGKRETVWLMNCTKILIIDNTHEHLNNLYQVQS